VGDLGERYDPTGQVMYGTSRTTAAQLLVNHCADIGIQGRAFVPGFDQRSDISFVSPADLEAAYLTGRNIISRLAAGQRDFLACISHAADHMSLEYNSVPFAQADNYSRSMPPRWIAGGNFDVTDEYADYMEPLIGNVPVNQPQRNAQPDFVAFCPPYVRKKLPRWQRRSDMTNMVRSLLSRKAGTAMYAKR
jgi:ATP-dependent phosphofructokinase / diphosphate-dependent phosphofructokinase